jgi:hypothetical protein
MITPTAPSGAILMQGNKLKQQASGHPLRRLLYHKRGLLLPAPSLMIRVASRQGVAARVQERAASKTAA